MVWFGFLSVGFDISTEVNDSSIGVNYVICVDLELLILPQSGMCRCRNSFDLMYSSILVVLPLSLSLAFSLIHPCWNQGF